MSDDNYEIGYKKPPKHSQFKKGMTGNSKGRPKKSKARANLAKIARRVFESDILATENSVTVKITRIEALLKMLTNKAIGGDIRATKISFDIYKKYAEPEILRAESLEEEHDYKNMTDEEAFRLYKDILKGP